LGETGSRFGGSFDGGGKTFRGSSISENLGKIQQEMGKKLGAKFWGFKLLITPALYSTRKTLETDNEKCRSKTSIFFLFFKPVYKPMGPLTSAGP